MQRKKTKQKKGYNVANVFVQVITKFDVLNLKCLN